MSELIDLTNAEKVIRRALDTYCTNRKQRDYLFKQLKIIGDRKEIICFKMKIKERLSENEKSR